MRTERNGGFIPVVKFHPHDVDAVSASDSTLFDVAVDACSDSIAQVVLAYVDGLSASTMNTRAVQMCKDIMKALKDDREEKEHEKR